MIYEAIPSGLLDELAEEYLDNFLEELLGSCKGIIPGEISEVNSGRKRKIPGKKWNPGRNFQSNRRRNI